VIKLTLVLLLFVAGYLATGIAMMKLPPPWGSLALLVFATAVGYALRPRPRR
jgi:hypothetical protein